MSTDLHMMRDGYLVEVRVTAATGLTAHEAAEVETLEAARELAPTLAETCIERVAAALELTEAARTALDALAEVRQQIARMSDVQLGLFHAYASDRQDGTVELYAEELRRRGFRPGARGQRKRAGGDGDAEGEAGASETQRTLDEAAEGLDALGRELTDTAYHTERETEEGA